MRLDDLSLWANKPAGGGRLVYIASSDIDNKLYCLSTISNTTTPSGVVLEAEEGILGPFKRFIQEAGFPMEGDLYSHFLLPFSSLFVKALFTAASVTKEEVEGTPVLREAVEILQTWQETGEKREKEHWPLREISGLGLFL